MTRLRALGLLPIAAALALAACGGDASPPPAPGSPENPLVAEQPEPGASSVPRESSSRATTGEPAQSGSAKQNSAVPRAPRSEPAPAAPVQGEGGTPEAPGYEALVKNQSRTPQRRFTPCNLVSEREARAIVGAPMQQPVEAPQGPTCIYRTQSGKGLVAVAVQRTDFGVIKPQLRDRRTVAVSGKAAFCGTYGQPMLYLPLGGDRVLTISARCRVAREFAQAALPHL